jgi:hypothetical protein
MANFDRIVVDSQPDGLNLTFDITNVFSNSIDVLVRIPTLDVKNTTKGITYSSLTSSMPFLSSPGRTNVSPLSKVTLSYPILYFQDFWQPIPGDEHQMDLYIFWKRPDEDSTKWRTTTTKDPRQYRRIGFVVPEPPPEPEEETPTPDPVDNFSFSASGLPLTINAGQQFSGSITVSGATNIQLTGSKPPNMIISTNADKNRLTFSGIATVADAGNWSIGAQCIGVNTGNIYNTATYNISVGAPITWNTQSLDDMYVGKNYQQVLDATNAESYSINSSPNNIGDFSISGNILSGIPGQDDTNKVMGSSYSFQITATNRVTSAIKTFSGIDLSFPGKRFDLDNNPQKIKTAQKYTNAGWVPIETSVRRYSEESSDKVSVVAVRDNRSSPEASISILNSGIATGDVILVMSADGTPRTQSQIFGYGTLVSGEQNGIGYRLQYKVVSSSIDSQVSVNRPSIVFILRDVSVINGIPQINYEFKTATSGVPDPNNYRTTSANPLIIAMACSDNTTTEATSLSGFTMRSSFGSTVYSGRTRQSMMAATYSAENIANASLISIGSFTMPGVSSANISFVVEVKKSEVASASWREFSVPS